MKKGFFTSNWVYILWFLVYFTLAWLMCGASAESFLILLFAYGISIGIALSPIGEWILQRIEGIRKPLTMEESQYLYSLFNEVYNEALEKNPRLSGDIQLYISDTMMINAFAIGRNTIAITTGAMQTLTPDQLKGIMAHEIGHLSYGHTKALLLNVVGNGIFTLFVIFFRLVLAILQTISEIFNGGIFYLIFTITKALLNVANTIIIYLGQIILALNSRSNEYLADEFALKIGYGEELISALYLLQRISMNYRPTLSERLKSSHPHIAKRIERLESMMENMTETIAIERT